MAPIQPLELDAKLIGHDCPACQQPFKEGEYVVLVALGPGADPEQRQRCRDGLSYDAVSIPVHHACATGWEYHG